MTDSKRVGERIASLRKERGLTGEQFAEHLNVSPQAVSKWETGRNLPETALLPSIARLLGVSIDTLLMPDKYPVKLHLGGRYIDGLPALRWGQYQDCTWAGSLKLLLDAMGVDASYPEIMGYSGACYFFSMTADWCPSAAMPQIAYDPAATFEQAVGVLRDSFALEDLDRMIKEAINRGMPVMMIQPRVEMEWGVLCGYTGDGLFYGRSYFDYLKPDDKDIFTGNNYFLADSYPGANPGMTYSLRSRTAPIPMLDALKNSLKIALDLYTAAPKYDGHYIFGEAAYDILIEGLRRDDSGFAALTQYGATGNGYILISRLIDARRAAHAFWNEKYKYLNSANTMKMRDVSLLYAGIVSALESVLPNEVIAPIQNGYPHEAWTMEERLRIADALSHCKHSEQQANGIIANILKNW